MIKKQHTQKKRTHQVFQVLQRQGDRGERRGSREHGKLHQRHMKKNCADRTTNCKTRITYSKHSTTRRQCYKAQPTNTLPIHKSFPRTTQGGAKHINVPVIFLYAAGGHPMSAFRYAREASSHEAGRPRPEYLTVLIARLTRSPSLGMK